MGCRPCFAGTAALFVFSTLLAGCATRIQAKDDTALAIEPQPGPGRVAVTLTGRGAEELGRYLERGEGPADEVLFLAVKPEGGSRTPLIPITGSYRSSNRPAAFMFHPQAPLTRGRRYVAVFDGPRLSPSLPRLEREHLVPEDRSPSPSRVTAIYPNGGVLPENLLKFYLHFSEPMAEGKLFRHVRLLDAEGKPVDQAFREVELWTEDHRRVTLWINPGRTKRQLGLSESLGPVLMAGRKYILEVLPGLPDQGGRPLARGMRHSFSTTHADREKPRIDAWAVAPPAADSRTPLRITFPEPMDHALAERVLRVQDHGEAELEGTGQVSEDGRRWSFTPVAAWSSGVYTLLAGGELEDLSGNSLYRAFETEDPRERPSTEPPLFRRSFHVR